MYSEKKNKIKTQTKKQCIGTHANFGLCDGIDWVNFVQTNIACDDFSNWV